MHLELKAVVTLPELRNCPYVVNVWPADDLAVVQVPVKTVVISPTRVVQFDSYCMIGL